MGPRAWRAHQRALEHRDRTMGYQGELSAGAGRWESGRSQAGRVNHPTRIADPALSIQNWHIHKKEREAVEAAYKLNNNHKILLIYHRWNTGPYFIKPESRDDIANRKVSQRINFSWSRNLWSICAFLYDMCQCGLCVTAALWRTMGFISHTSLHIEPFYLIILVKNTSVRGFGRANFCRQTSGKQGVRLPCKKPQLAPSQLATAPHRFAWSTFVFPGRVGKYPPIPKSDGPKSFFCAKQFLRKFSGKKVNLLKKLDLRSSSAPCGKKKGGGENHTDVYAAPLWRVQQGKRRNVTCVAILRFWHTGALPIAKRSARRPRHGASRSLLSGNNGKAVKKLSGDQSEVDEVVQGGRDQAADRKRLACNQPGYQGGPWVPRVLVPHGVRKSVPSFQA